MRSEKSFAEKLKRRQQQQRRADAARDFGLAAIDRVCNADVSEILFYCRLINDFVDRHVDEWTMKAHLREVQNASADFKKLVSERAPAFLVPYDA